MNFTELGESQDWGLDVLRDAYEASHKFDVGEWKSIPREFVEFGSMLLEDKIFHLPFKFCVFGGGYDLLETQVDFEGLDASSDYRNDVHVRWDFKRDPTDSDFFGFWTKGLAVSAWDLNGIDAFKKETQDQCRNTGADMNADFLLTVYADFSKWRRGWVRIGSMVVDQGGAVCWFPNPDTYVLKDGDRNLEEVTLFIMAKIALWGVLGVVASLTSKSTKQEIVVAPEKLNRSRIKKGKMPIDEYRKITIGHVPDIPRTINGRTIEGRASPRLHWRRGHYRTLAPDVRVPVAPALVGLAENGIIDKDYIIKHARESLRG